MQQSPTLTNLVDDAAILSLEHQLRLEELIGDDSWSVDLREPRFEFTGSRPITCTGFHVLGTAASTPRSWLWAWANPGGFPEPLVALSVAVRDFGQHHGIAELTSNQVPFGALPGAPDEAVAAATALTEAAKAISGRWTSAVLDAGGTQVAFILEHPSFLLPPPDVARVTRVIPEAISRLPVTDHRRAVWSYAGRRGLGTTFSPDYTHLALTGPAFRVDATFDHYARLTNLRAA